MRIFSKSDREIFEDMCIAIELCTESTEMLLQKESLIPDFPEIPTYKPIKAVEQIAIDALYFPEDWA